MSDRGTVSGQGAGRFLQTFSTGKGGSKSLAASWDGLPTMRTVSFNLQSKKTSTYPIKCEALVSFSVNGNTTTRRISVVNGASISGVCEAITVAVADHTTVPALAATFDYAVDVLVAPGTRSFGHQPPVLEQQSNATNLVAGNQQSYPVPPDCGAVAVFVSVGFFDADPQPIRGKIVVQQMQGTFEGKRYDPRDYPEWVPLSPGCDTIVVTNAADSGGDAFVTVTLGIDG